MSEHRRVKQFIYYHGVRDLTLELLSIFEPLTRTYDLDDASLARLVEWDKQAMPVLRADIRCLPKPVNKGNLTLTKVHETVYALIARGHIPIGGEDFGNMLCIEDAILRCRQLLKTL